MKGTVFISCTSEDLRDHRRAVHKALKKKGFSPIDMDGFGARPWPPLRACLDAVGRAELFVGIYAWRYGVIPEGSENSFTQQEFEEAQRLRKPTFCFFVDENYEWPGQRDVGPAAERLAAFKSTIDRQLLRATFTDAKGLGRLVVESLIHWTGGEVELTAYLQHRRTALMATADREIEPDVEEMAASGRRLEVLPASQAPFLKQLELHPRLVLLGAGGAGKSTALGIVERALLGRPGSTPNKRLPLLLDLSHLQTELQDLDLALLKLVEKTLRRDSTSGDELDLGLVRRWLDQGPPLTILFDELDQVGKRRPQVGRAISDFSSRYPRHRFVLTSRPHGFKPFEGWKYFQLSGFDRGQSREFLRRQETQPATVEWLLADTASQELLSLPLYLKFAASLSHPKLPGSGFSRAGLIQEYVEDLLSRPAGSAVPSADGCRDMLTILAQHIPAKGAVLSRREALEVLPDRIHPERANLILDQLCGCGLLVENRGELAFAHQVLREYFWAAYFVASWRGNQVGLSPRPPRQIRRQLRDPSLEDRLALAVAHFSESETGPALDAAAKANWRLAVLWADELGMENRGQVGRENLPRDFVSFAWWARRYSSWKLGRFLYRFAAFWVSFETFIFVPVFLLGFVLMLAAVSREKIEFGIPLATATAMIVFSMFLAARWWRGLDTDGRKRKLAAVFELVPALRHPPLRSALTALAIEVEHSPTAGQELQIAAELATRLGTLDGPGLVRWLKEQKDKPTAVRKLAGTRAAPVLPLMDHLLGYRNHLDLHALFVLAERARRFRTEKAAIQEVLRLHGPRLEAPAARRGAARLAAALGVDPGPSASGEAWIAIFGFLTWSGLFFLKVRENSILGPGESSPNTAFLIATSLSWLLVVLGITRDRDLKIRFSATREPLSRRWVALLAALPLGATVALSLIWPSTQLLFWAQLPILFAYLVKLPQLEERTFPVDWKALEAELARQNNGRNG